MPRELPIGNGTLLVNFDSLYQVRDIYFPYVGMENHTQGHPFRFGVWVGGAFRWIDDAAWVRDLRYQTDTLVTPFDEVAEINRSVRRGGPDDPRIVRTMEAVRGRLWVKTEVGGVARYENDYYHQVTKDIERVPGNPWFICTLWLAQWHIALAKSEEDLRPALDILRWVASRALPSGMLAEQVHPFTNAPLSVSPLTWSHAAFVSTFLEYAHKLASLAVCPTCGHPPTLRKPGGGPG